MILSDHDRSQQYLKNFQPIILQFFYWDLEPILSQSSKSLIFGIYLKIIDILELIV